MVVDEAINRGDKKKLLEFNINEKPVALQLGGSAPKLLAEATKIGEDFGYDEINLNLGCPSKKVEKNRFGACLMKEPNLVADCLSKMQSVTKLPVTIKTRIGYDDDLREVATGENGLFNTAKAGSIFIDNSTVSAEVSRELNKKANDKGFSFLDAPISGGQAGAEGGILTVMVGGDEEVFKKAEPVIDCYSKKVKLIGPCGSGQLTKMMNQMCIAGTVQGLSEAINFGINAGLDMDKVMETISKGAAQSWQMENRYRTMTDDKFDYGFAIDWMRKDLKIAIEEAKKNGSPVPITEIIDGYYAEVQEMGGNRWDSSGLIARLKKKK